MNILHIMPYAPIPPDFGGALRVFHILRNLSRHHDVTVATIGWPEDEYDFKQYFDGRLRDVHILPRRWARKYRRLSQFYSFFSTRSNFRLLGTSAELQNRLNELFDKNQYDVVLTEFAHMAFYRMNTNAVKILDAHNVEYNNFRQMWLNARTLPRRIHYEREYKKFYREEVEACSRQDAIFTTSEPDKILLDRDVPHVPKFVLPNGVDTEYFTNSSDGAVEPYSLVFTGMMGYLPNYDGILEFLDNTFPLVLKKIPQAKIYVVGNAPPKQLLDRAAENVIITGYVKDVRPYVWKSSVYIVPLRMGSGTRLKIGEAMAMQKPIVTTSIGCEGIDVINGESALIADDPQTFADAVVELLRNEALRLKLTHRSTEIVHAKYEWKVIGAQMDKILTALISQSGKSSTHRQRTHERALAH